MKKTLQKEVKELATHCLENSGIHCNYEDVDLMNASFIFTHFLMDVIYTENHHIPFQKRVELANTTGKEIHELIKSCTGKEMAKIVHNYLR